MQARRLQADEDYPLDHPGFPPSDGRKQVLDRSLADVESSEGFDGLHYPVLDIDFPCEVVPSETPGHYHLKLNLPEGKGLTWAKYETLIHVLAATGIIEKGYASASISRGATFIATRPWKGRAKRDG